MSPCASKGLSQPRMSCSLEKMLISKGKVYFLSATIFFTPGDLPSAHLQGTPQAEAALGFTLQTGSPESGLCQDLLARGSQEGDTCQRGFTVPGKGCALLWNVVLLLQAIALEACSPVAAGPLCAPKTKGSRLASSRHFVRAAVRRLLPAVAAPSVCRHH